LKFRNPQSEFRNRLTLNPQIVLSASRRTDIPAFYMPWFMDRIKSGFFEDVRLDQLKQICDQFGSRAVNWRFDPICFFKTRSHDGIVQDNLCDLKRIAGFFFFRSILENKKANYNCLFCYANPTPK
jgi:hypothetical protein